MPHKTVARSDTPRSGWWPWPSLVCGSQSCGMVSAMDLSNIDAWLTSAAVIATCALVFTVGSFWWLNARQGRLKSFEPHTFSFGMDQWKVRLRLPLILYNNGAIPIVVQNIRLQFTGESDSVQPLSWVASLSRIKPEKDELRESPLSSPSQDAQLTKCS